MLIKVSDKIGIDMHFIRYIYLTLFDTRKPAISSSFTIKIL
jgi:hypothetical protein